MRHQMLQWLIPALGPFVEDRAAEQPDAIGQRARILDPARCQRPPLVKPGKVERILDPHRVERLVVSQFLDQQHHLAQRRGERRRYPRERRADIPMLAEAFVAKFAEQQQSVVKGINASAMQALMTWPWPGNVRELENVIERGVTLSSQDRLDVDSLPPAMRQPHVGVAMPMAASQSIVDEVPAEGLDLEATLEAYERRLLEKALLRTRGRKKKAADLLRVSFRSFRYRLAKLGLSGADDDDES